METSVIESAVGSDSSISAPLRERKNSSSESSVSDLVQSSPITKAPKHANGNAKAKPVKATVEVPEGDNEIHLTGDDASSSNNTNKGVEDSHVANNDAPPPPQASEGMTERESLMALVRDEAAKLRAEETTPPPPPPPPKATAGNDLAHSNAEEGGGGGNTSCAVNNTKATNSGEEDYGSDFEEASPTKPAAAAAAVAVAAAVPVEHSPEDPRRRRSERSSSSSSGASASSSSSSYCPLVESGGPPASKPMKSTEGATVVADRGVEGSAELERPPSRDEHRGRNRQTDGNKHKKTKTQSEKDENHTPLRGGHGGTAQQRAKHHDEQHTLVLETPRQVAMSDTVEQVFLRSTPRNGGTSSRLDGSQRRTIEDLRYWLSPYESSAAGHTRLVLRDVKELESQRRHEAETYRQQKEAKREAEVKKHDEFEAKHPVKKVAQPSPRLCKPKKPHAPVGHYAPKTPHQESATRATSSSSLNTKSHHNQQRSADEYSNEDFTPHYMRPLPPPPEPRPIHFRPQTEAFHRGGGSGNDNDAATTSARLSSEEFAQRFYQTQVDGHNIALNKTFLKLTGAPMPPPPPRPKVAGLRGAPPEAGDAAGGEDGDEEEEDEEEKHRREEFARDMSRRFHDDEVQNRARRREMLLAKYGIVLDEGSTTTSGKHTRALSPSQSSSLVAKVYTNAIDHLKKTQTSLWNEMEAVTDAESVHHGVRVTDGRWGEIVDRLYVVKAPSPPPSPKRK